MTLFVNNRNAFKYSDEDVLKAFKNFDENLIANYSELLENDLVILDSIMKIRFINSMVTFSEEVPILEIGDNMDIWNSNQVFGAKTIVYNFTEFKCYTTMLQKINQYEGKSNEFLFCLRLLLIVFTSNVLLSENNTFWMKSVMQSSGNLICEFMKNIREKYYLSMKLIVQSYLEKILVEIKEQIPDHILNNLLLTDGIKGLQKKMMNSKIV